MQSASYKRCTACQKKRPLSAFHEDARYRGGHVHQCRRCRARGGKRAAALRRTADYEMRRAAAQRRARVFAARVPSDFGHWLAGFADGEGCFHIRINSRAGGRVTYACAFRLQLRDDDDDILNEIRLRTNIGAVHYISGTGNARSSAAWSVGSKADLLALVAIFDRFPLRAKKARDFGIWREAVLYWATNYRKQAAVDGIADWSRMAEFKNRLEAARVYH